jgi:hypothetical protein
MPSGAHPEVLQEDAVGLIRHLHVAPKSEVTSTTANRRFERLKS